jgi:predicted nucleic acid-binding Zn finger protein
MTQLRRPDETRADFASRFAHYSRHRGQFDRAIEAVLGGCVKRHTFMPSGRILHTVVGKSGEEFIDPARPFCSCKNFFFRVLGGQAETCYHLLSYEIAKEAQLFDEIEFNDEEFGTFLGLLTLDLLKDKED